MFNINSIRALFTSPRLMTIIMPVIMIYLVIGTVAQKYIGLYAATNLFFAAPIIWVWGIVPLPGMPILCALIFLNLACKLILKSPWVIRNSGIIITHIGVTLLLVGGLFTTLFSTEGYIDLAVGEQKSYAVDYHDREFIIMDANGHTVFRVPHDDINVNDVFTVPNTTIRIKILQTCQNCAIQKRAFVNNALNNADTYHGMAQHMKITKGALEATNEENMAGVSFALSGTDTQNNQNGVYITLEDVPQVPRITAPNTSYIFTVRRVRRDLPFTIALLDFKREVHPATNLPKSYESRVRIIDGDARWESVISMNAPLRYRGYTLFQSSFAQNADGDISVLAAVWNVGRAFPYISGIVMCLGLIIHLYVRRRKLPTKPAR